MNMKMYLTFSLLCILILSQVDALHDFHFKTYGKVCQSMQYMSPWQSPVNVDQYIMRLPYIKRYKMRKSDDENKDSLESIMGRVQSALSTSKGIALLMNGKNTEQTGTELFSHFLCGYDFKNEATTNFVPLAFHICQRENVDSISSSLFIRNIVGKIGQEIPAFGNLIDKDTSIRKTMFSTKCAEQPIDCLEKGLLEPLRKIQKPFYKTLIVVGGLEECSLRSDSNSINEIIFHSMHKLPSWLKFLVISKSNYHLRKQLQEHGFKYGLVKERTKSFWMEEQTNVQNFDFGGYEVFMLIVLCILIFDGGIQIVETQNSIGNKPRRHDQGTRYTSLHREAYKGSIRNMQFFISIGANINEIHDQVYLTPLHLAAIQNQFHACEWLLQNGANSNAIAHLKSYEHIKCILSNECKRDVADFEGATPLRLAVLFKHELSVHVLSKWPVSKKEMQKCLRIARHSDEIRRILLSCDLQVQKKRENKIQHQHDIEELHNQISKKLFERHSNLNIINGGNFQPSDTCHNSSITLYCDKKGQIPKNETKFPKVLEINDKSIQIFIKEGDFKLCPGLRTTKSEWNNPLRMGACIGVQGIMSSATMGPFVDLPDGSLGFLTCAHLFHNIPVGATIIQPSHLAFAGFDITENDKVCGTLVHKMFEPQRVVSVDVAVVKITSRIPNRGMFAIGCNEEILKAGFDQPPVFDSGSIKEHISPTDANRPIVKFGSETGLTKGVLTLNGSHVKISDQINFESPCGYQTLTLHNQYEIQQIGNIPFFKPGDSGSGVFIIDDHKELHCIGMAIGCTSYGSAIVTPVGAIFEALGLPKRLKTFYHESMEE